MNSTPRVETAEISDAELDNVSGGLSLNAVSTATGWWTALLPFPAWSTRPSAPSRV